MWTISQLKQRGKACFKRNYWKAVLVALIITFAGGMQGSNVISCIFTFSINRSITSGVNNEVKRNVNRKEVEKKFNNPGNQKSFEQFNNDDWNEYFNNNFNNDDPFNSDENLFGNDSDNGNLFDDNYNVNNGSSKSDVDDAISSLFGDNDANDIAAILVGLLIIGLIVFIIIMVIVIALAIVVDVFIMNPLHVGTQRFLVHNLTADGQIADVGFAFDRNYKNQVRVMFFRDLYTILWTLLLVIPGIIKSYEYRMIPYLMAENPDMDKEHAFAASKHMMQGNKWRAFVLDLSFIGWWLLSAITLGIVGIFYVNPYYVSTCAALYEALKAIKGIPEAGVAADYAAQGDTYSQPDYMAQDTSFAPVETPTYNEPETTGYSEPQAEYNEAQDTDGGITWPTQNTDGIEESASEEHIEPQASDNLFDED